MKLHSLRTMLRWPYVVALLLLACAVAVPALAQPDPAPKPSAGQGRPQLRQLRRKLLQQRAGLSEEQIDKIEAAARKHAEERQRIRREMKTARQELNQLFRDDSDDEQAWRAALDGMETARRAQQRLRQTHYEELGTFLTAKQQAKLLRTMYEVKRKLRNQRARRPKRKAPGGRRRPRRRPPR